MAAHELSSVAKLAIPVSTVGTRVFERQQWISGRFVGFGIRPNFDTKLDSFEKSSYPVCPALLSHFSSVQFSRSVMSDSL